MPEVDPIGTCVLRQPKVDDAAKIWQLVIDSGVLDRNSAYLYLLLCRDFRNTCLVAERAGAVVGFVAGYLLPNNPTVLFVWQIGVHSSARRQGLALQMLRRLIADAGPAVQFVEATVSATNRPSRRLFESLARDLGCSLIDEAGFDEALFPNGDHEAEPRIRIGLIPSAESAVDAD